MDFNFAHSNSAQNNVTSERDNKNNKAKMDHTTNSTGNTQSISEEKNISHKNDRGFQTNSLIQEGRARWINGMESARKATRARLLDAKTKAARKECRKHRAKEQEESKEAAAQQIVVLPFIPSMFTHFIDRLNCQRMQVAVSNVRPRVPRAISEVIAVYGTGDIGECNNALCNDEILILYTHMVTAMEGGNINFYYNNPYMNRSRMELGTDEIDLNRKIEVFCESCCGNLNPCQFFIAGGVIGQFGSMNNEVIVGTGGVEVRFTRIFCSAMASNGNKKCDSCMKGRTVPFHGETLQTSCTDAVSTVKLMDGNQVFTLNYPNN